MQNANESIFIRLMLGVSLAGMLFASAVRANPTGAQIANGVVKFSHPDAATLNISNTPGAVINWQGFSINANELTRFIQQGAGSAVLNRVIGSDPSKIMGQLMSNGQVFLINRNGIVFGANSQIDVAGMVASTLNISDSDFLAKNFRFDSEGKAGSIINQGSIHSRGSVLLIAPDVENSGVIQSDNGDVVLAAGERVFMADLDADGIVFEMQAPQNKAVNLGEMIAKQGAVGVFASQLRHSGYIQADRAVRGADGKVRLEASGSALVSGSISVQGRSGQAGGSVHVLAKQIELRGAQIDAGGETGGGEVKIGGDFQGGGSLGRAINTTLDTATRINADATSSGNGGEIIVWSDNHTDTRALLTARGGPAGGDGGLIETSGKKTLDFGRAADVSAPRGKPGTWLLDPEDIVIDGGKASSIETALNSGSSVSIKTSDSGEGEGNITVESSITKTDGDDTSLSLTAHNEIRVNAPIRSEHNKLDVRLKAGRRVRVNSDIDTNGGDYSSVITGIVVPEIQESDESSASDTTETPVGENTELLAEQTTGSEGEEPGDEAVVVDVETVVPDTVPTDTTVANPVPESGGVDQNAQQIAATPAQQNTLDSSGSEQAPWDGSVDVNAAITSGGGNIFIDAGNNNLASVGGELNARNAGTGEVGGNVTVLGGYVAIEEGATVDASGHAGGGEVLIGGDYKGSNPEVRNATGSYVGEGVTIRSDALSDGDGGKVIVWADEVTRFYGDISATGGTQGGDGGFVETSGKQYLEAYGSVDASASNGLAGTWLLDPRDVELRVQASSGGTFDASSPNTFTPTGDTAVADISTIETSLGGGTSVTITTSASGTQDGDITVVDSIYTSTAGGATLTLDAADDIFINNDISSGDDTLNLTLIADDVNVSDGAHGVVIDAANATNVGSSIYVSGINELDVQGAGLAIRGSGMNEAQVEANQVTANVTGGVQIESSNTNGAGNARLHANAGSMSITAGHVSVLAHEADAGLDSFGNPMVINASFTIGTGAHAGASLLVKTDGPGSAYINAGVQDIDAFGGIEVVSTGSNTASINSSSNTDLIAPFDQDISAEYVKVQASGDGAALINSLGGSQNISTSGTITALPGPEQNVSILVENTGNDIAGIISDRWDEVPPSSGNWEWVDVGDQTISAGGGQGILRVTTVAQGDAFIVGGVQYVDLDGGLEIISDGAGYASLTNRSNTDGTAPYDQDISSQYVMVRASDAGGALIDSQGGSQQITTTGVITTSPGDNEDVAVLVESTGDNQAIITTSRYDEGPLVDQGTQHIMTNSTADGGVRIAVGQGATTNGSAGINGDDQVINADFVEVSAVSGSAGLDTQVDPGDIGSQGSQTLNIDGSKPGTDDAIRVIATGGGNARIGNDAPTPQLISITGEKADIHIESDGQDTYSSIRGPQQIHGANAGDSAGDIELIGRNGGFAFLRAYGADQTILANSLHIQGESGGWASVRAEIPSQGSGTDALVQTITLTGLVENEDVGLLLRSVDDGGAQVASRNRSDDFIGQGGVSQNFLKIGLEQNITVSNGVRIISEDSNGVFDGDAENSSANIQGGGQTITAQFIEVISHDGDASISNLNNLDEFGNDANKEQIITTTGSNADGQAILVHVDSANPVIDQQNPDPNNGASEARISSYLPNVPGEPPVGGGNPDGTIGAQQTLNALSGSIRVHNENGGDEDEQAQIYGGGQSINTQFIEVLADDGPTGIWNESNQNNPQHQIINTEGAIATGPDIGVGILVRSTDNYLAEIGSYDRVNEVSEPNVGRSFGMPQTISVANGASIRVISQTDAGETGEADIFGGDQQITAESIEVIAGNGDAGIYNDVLSNIPGNGQVITADCANAACTGVLVRSDGAGEARISSFFATTEEIVGASQDINVMNPGNGGGLLVQTTSSGDARIYGGPQTIDALLVQEISGGTGSASIENDPPGEEAPAPTAPDEPAADAPSDSPPVSDAETFDPPDEFIEEKIPVEAEKTIEEIVALPTNEIVAQTESTQSTLLVAAATEQSDDGSDGDSDDSDAGGGNKGTGSNNQAAKDGEEKPSLMCR